MNVFVLLKYSNHCWGEGFEASVFYNYGTAKDAMIAQWNESCKEFDISEDMMAEDDNLSCVEDFGATIDDGDELCINWEIQEQDIL